MTKIKLCGLFRPEDITYVNELRPDYAGFILEFPKSHRNIQAERAKEYRQRLSADTRAVGVFVDQSCEKIAALTEQIGLDVIQLHGHEDDAFIQELKTMVTIPVWKAFRVRGPGDLEAAAKTLADEILLDNGYGTGQAFDWSVTENFSRPFILAGGLDPGNVSRAILGLHPLAVDVSSGVETDGYKDKRKMAAFVAAVRKEDSHG